MSEPRASDDFDVVVIGGGPSGLSAAIRLKQQAASAGTDLRVCLVEKGAEIGAHILSGAVIETRALTELIPDWKDKGAPVTVEAKDDHFVFLTETKGIRLPTPPQMHNHGNYIISLSNLCRWLGSQAESLGVEIYPGIAATEVLYGADGAVKGVATGDVGIGKQGRPTENYARGMELRARFTLFAEGCRGSLTKTLFKKFDLRKGIDPQTYGIGIKELWQVDPKKSKPGTIMHTVGWPLTPDTYGGSFLYHLDNNQVACGFVIGLSYKNPYLSPYSEFQRWKHHPRIQALFEGATPIGYGARAISEGGFQAVPRLIFPGGALIGDTAGFLNLPKIKGTHNAMKSGIVAADAALQALKENKGASEAILLTQYPEMLKKSWLWDDLYRARNIGPYMSYGLYPGIALSAIDTYVFRGKAPFTLHHKHQDHETLLPAAKATPIQYPAPDGKISFDLLTNLSRSNTNHNEDQPPHLKLVDAAIPTKVNMPVYAGPESRYCPAGVYEYVTDDSGNARLQINAQNCVHCKTCDIKDPTQNINWVPPEGGGGPAYSGM